MASKTLHVFSSRICTTFDTFICCNLVLSYYKGYFFIYNLQYCKIVQILQIVQNYIYHKRKYGIYHTVQNLKNYIADTPGCLSQLSVPLDFAQVMISSRVLCRVGSPLGDSLSLSFCLPPITCAVYCICKILKMCI